MKFRSVVFAVAAACASPAWAGGVTFADGNAVEAAIAKARAKKKVSPPSASVQAPSQPSNAPLVEVDQVSKDAPLTAQVMAAGRYDVLFADGVVRKALERWAKLANVQLVYEVERDHRVDGEGDFGTDFEKALLGLMQTTASTDMPLRSCLHQQAPRSVVRIIRRTATCE